jgi:hypothetical protein
VCPGEGKIEGASAGRARHVPDAPKSSSTIAQIEQGMPEGIETPTGNERQASKRVPSPPIANSTRKLWTGWKVTGTDKLQETGK